jgi:hypothetical protein
MRALMIVLAAASIAAAQGTRQQPDAARASAVLGGAALAGILIGLRARKRVKHFHNPRQRSGR